MTIHETLHDTLHDTVTGLDLEAVRPGQAGYDEAAATFFARGKPDLVVRPRDACEVAAAVRYARREGLTLSVRSGGHSGAGFGTHDEGLVIDLAHIDHVELVDPLDGLVRVGTGATWGQVAAALQPHGLGITAGDTNDVGVGGLALGGGVGWLVRRDGLTVDHIVAATVVTAEGERLRASADSHPELFWALRGGGGNVGIVVNLELRATPVGSVHFGVIAFASEDPAGLARGWRNLMREAPDELTTTLAMVPAMGGQPPRTMLLVCLADADEAAATEILAPFRQLARVVSDGVRLVPYADVLEDAAPMGAGFAFRNAMVPHLDDELLTRISREVARGGMMFALRGLGGAMARVAPDATAFAHRDAEVMVVAGMFLPPEPAPGDVDAMLARWSPIAAHGTGAYAGFLSSATPADVAEVFPPKTYARLASVKRAYDPDNVFHRNHNVPPRGLV